MILGSTNKILAAVGKVRDKNTSVQREEQLFDSYMATYKWFRSYFAG